MLRRLKLGNFKSWQEADLAFGRITGLFGTNSSGKSSLIQALLLLKQTRESADRAAALELNGRFVELGTAADVVHAHDEGRAIELEVGFEHDSDLRIDGPSDRRGAAIADSKGRAVRGQLAISSQALGSRSLTHSAGAAEFSLRPRGGNGDGFDLAASVPDLDFSFIRNRGRAWALPPPVKTYRFPDQARLYYQNAGFLADLEAAFEEALDKLYYLGPLREHPRRDYLWARSRPADVGDKGERTIDAIVAAQDAGEMQNLKRRGRLRSFSYIVAHWLRELGLVRDFRVVEIAPGSNRWQAKVRTRRGGAEVMLTDVGFGVSQVLPVVTLLHYVPEGATVLLEQPEIHLHPLAQTELADVIIHAATHRGVQVIVESHSEHLLLRLQRRVADERVAAEDVRLYFCDVSGGASTIEALDLDAFGNIRNWPARFMGDAFSETAEAELARVRRMRPAAE